jgi:hypothetical protein
MDEMQLQKNSEQVNDFMVNSFTRVDWKYREAVRIGLSISLLQEEIGKKNAINMLSSLSMIVEQDPKIFAEDMKNLFAFMSGIV